MTLPEKERVYIAIDLKSFYASVECVERGLDPLRTNLVVADLSRTEKTICLAVSPSLKAYGIPGRARLFEVVQKVREVNSRRKSMAPGRTFTGQSWDDDALKADPSLALSYVTAPPRMAEYMKWSTRIYNIYLKYIAPEDIHVYSIDEVFMDVTQYLEIYKVAPSQLAGRIIRDVLSQTGITAAAGIAPNLYLCKVALDIVAKHVPADQDGVRIAWLDEMSYRRLLWDHTPITDFWRVGKGYARRLEEYGLFTMGDVARCSVGKSGEYYSEELLYRLFGINAQLLIDHAWGWEPCTIEEIKAYKPRTNSLWSGQVLRCPSSWDQARLAVKEMADQLALDLVEKGMVTDQLVITVGYDRENLTDPARSRAYCGEVAADRYGRKIPKNGHGTWNLGQPTSSASKLREAAVTLFDRITDPKLLVRRLYVTAGRAVAEGQKRKEEVYEQLDLFTDYAALEEERKKEQETLARERKMQQAMLDIRKKFGKNAILKGMNLEEGATARERNGQIGGHKA